MGSVDMSTRKPKPLDASFLARKGRASAEGFSDPNAARKPPPETDAPRQSLPPAEYSEPEILEPEILEPEITEPKTTEPEIPEPEITEPEIIDPPPPHPSSLEGEGATSKENYWIKAADEIPEARREGRIPATESKTVLIVEDDPQNMNLFDELLQIHGCETVQATSGWEALDLARTCRPDLILLDIQLPDIPGTAVAELIKGDADLSHIPVIAVSAFVADGLEEEIFEAGCEAFVTKPITMAGFIETVEEFLG